MSPMMIVKGKTAASLYNFNTEAVPTGTRSFQEKRWFNVHLGEIWFKDIFLKECGSEEVDRFVFCHFWKNSSGRVFRRYKSCKQHKTSMADIDAVVMGWVGTAAANLITQSEDNKNRGNQDVDDLVVFIAAFASVNREDRYKISQYTEQVVPKYLPDSFKRMFRVSRETFETILHHLGNNTALQRRASQAGRPQVPIEKDLLMMLWYLGTQETVKSISDRFDVQEHTFICHNRKLLDIFSSELLRKFVVWPKDINEKQRIINEFENKRGFPGVLGAIDGTHISIKAPGDKEADYINRKGFHSVILQAICRHDRLFTDVYCGWPGRVHDARVYRNSPFFQRATEFCGQNHIIGDGAYPLSRFLMKPYRDTGNLNNNEKRFNRMLCGTRSIIENAFGILKIRFRRLQHVNMNEIEFIVKTIVTTCVVHNICILNQDELDEQFEIDANENQETNGIQVHDHEGTLKRLLITRQIANR